MLRVTAIMKTDIQGSYQGTRSWLSPEVPVVWYAIDRATWQGRTFR